MSVSIMRFKSGASNYAIAAGCIEAIGPAVLGIEHLATVLDRALPSRSGERTLRIVSGDRRAEISVDGPVELVELEQADIAPCRTTTSSTILGFARVNGEMCALLDAESLVTMTREGTR